MDGGYENFMVRIEITLREIELLDLCYEIMNIPKNYSINQSCIVVEENELENLEIMFHCILDTFIRIGLHENDEPNEIGEELENLNQKINHRYVELNV